MTALNNTKNTMKEALASYFGEQKIDVRKEDFKQSLERLVDDIFKFVSSDQYVRIEGCRRTTEQLFDEVLEINLSLNPFELLQMAKVIKAISMIQKDPSATRVAKTLQAMEQVKINKWMKCRFAAAIGVYIDVE